MAVLITTEQELKRSIAEKELLVVFYYRRLCLNCLSLLSTFEQISATYPKISFVSIVAGENITLEKLIEKEEKPFICLYKSGLLTECKTIAGTDELLSAINRLLM